MTSINELARGVILAGFEGETLDPALPEFGGYVLFARNVASLAQVRALTDALRTRRSGSASPIVAIDQEGGRVARQRYDVEPMPSMMALGAAADLELAGRAGEQVAFDLRRAGCTLNLAPVLDLSSFPGNTVIGTRSLGSDPEAVAALGAAYAAGLERGGIAACYKHFSGHGATAVDSHYALPYIDSELATLRVRDLVPFAHVAASALAMMPAHIVVRDLDDTHPATTSRRVVTDLLRGELGFDGVVITDCLQMDALAQSGGAVANGVAALATGCDLLTVSHSVELALQLANAIERAVGDGTLPRERLEEAYGRVMRLRETAQPPLPLDEFPPHPGVGREIARRGITLVRGFAHADPLATIVVSFESIQTEGINVVAEPAESLRRESPALKELRLPLDPSAEQVEAARREIAASGRRPLLLARRAHLHPQQAAAIDAVVADAADSIVVSMLEPFDVPLFARARHVLAAYGDDIASIGGLADVLFGGSLPTGQLPVANVSP